MKVKISRATEYVGKENAPVESYDLEVEKEVTDVIMETVATYLRLRNALNKGIKEGN